MKRLFKYIITMRVIVYLNALSRKGRIWKV